MEFLRFLVDFVQLDLIGSWSIADIFRISLVFFQGFFILKFFIEGIVK